ncbi:MAG TPA: protein-glutamate O-methyltransferase CheR [Terriglobia bacterium]|nr:protein-glutamate O-methyltransferase CheR [Terriglobia bacterium]
MTSTTIVEQNLNDFRQLIEQRSGIRFDSSRERFFSTRIREHVQAKGLSGPAELMPLLLSSNVEYEALLQRMLTHETSFFRYPSAYKALKDRVLPEVYTKKLWDKPRKLRIWSAGCSTGEEPYSISITVAESPSFATGWETEILATDVSRQAIARATQAVYSPRGVASMTPQQIEAFFNPVDGQYEVKPAIRGKVSLVVMNLVQCLYLGRMDCIFCMNVLIYFSDEKREQLIRCFYDCLEPGGYLMLGHSDSLGNLPTKFEKIVFDDFILYRKPGGEITTFTPRSPA